MMETIVNDESIEIGQQLAPLLLCHFCNEPITKMKGQDSDSISNHHITYIPEVVVPTHKRCHVKYHKTHPDHPINPEAECRKRLIMGGGDVICHFCNEPITKMKGTESESLLIHSLDGDHNNWDPSNKVLTHRGCHQSFHHSGPKCVFYGHGPEIGMTGKTHSKSTREKMRNAKLGKTYEQIFGEEKGRELRILRSELFRGDKNPMKDPEVSSKVANKKRGVPRPDMRGDKNPMRDPIIAKKQGEAMRGAKNPMRRPEVVAKRKKTMLERYGAMGVKNPESFRRNVSKASKKSWKLRKERYPPNGMKPKSQAVV